MPSVLIGNVKGPQGGEGPQGPEGKQGKEGSKGIRGSKWYDGANITGTSVEPTVFRTGIVDALPDDYYLNSDTGGVYRCVTGGDASVAEWVFIGNIRGAMPDVENGFESKSKKNALSANAGRVLYEKLCAAGVFPKEIKVECEEAIHAVKIKMENKNTVVRLQDAEGNTGVYSYVKLGSEETTEELIWIGEGIGLTSGAVIQSITSTDAGVLEYELYDIDNNAVMSYVSDIWSAICALQNDMKESIVITENSGDEIVTYKTYELMKLIEGVRNAAFLITHAKAVWWNKAENITLYDKIMDNAFDKDMIVTDEEELKNLEEENAGEKLPDAYLVGQFMKYVESLPVIRSGTEEPDDSVGKDDDIYIHLEK